MMNESIDFKAEASVSDIPESREAILIIGSKVSTDGRRQLVSIETKRLVLAGNVVIVDPVTSGQVRFSEAETQRLASDCRLTDQMRRMISMVDRVHVVNPDGNGSEVIERLAKELDRPVTYLIDPTVKGGNDDVRS